MRDLEERTELDGTLGYGESRQLAVSAQGTVTWLPDEGTVDRPRPAGRRGERPGRAAAVRRPSPVARARPRRRGRPRRRDGRGQPRRPRRREQRRPDRRPGVDLGDDRCARGVAGRARRGRDRPPRPGRRGRAAGSRSGWPVTWASSAARPAARSSRWRARPGRSPSTSRPPARAWSPSACPSTSSCPTARWSPAPWRRSGPWPRRPRAADDPTADQTPTIEVTVSLDDPAAAGALDQAPVKVGVVTSAASGRHRRPGRLAAGPGRGRLRRRAPGGGRRHRAGGRRGRGVRRRVGPGHRRPRRGRRRGGAGMSERPSAARPRRARPGARASVARAARCEAPGAET